MLMVAASRVYLGAHWTTDVTAGILLGLFWVSVCSTGTRYVTERLAARIPVQRPPAISPDT
ncbi:MAG TPA: phosphatase PAP2 family protein, partial [Thermoanaerobaculia bacterium]|nr:phosphatase PAP2 family protein [Thermoanaerobaculia bacterium]